MFNRSKLYIGVGIGSGIAPTGIGNGSGRTVCTVRLALQRTGSLNAAAWIKEIQNADQAAMTESGIPIRPAAALLLIDHDRAAALPETEAFLNETLSQLASGCWPLNAAQWALYAREICSSLDCSSDLRSATLATAGFLEAFADAIHEVLALDKSLEWRRDQPFQRASSRESRAWLSSFPERTGIQAARWQAPNWPAKLKPDWPL